MRDNCVCTLSEVSLFLCQVKSSDREPIDLTGAGLAATLRKMVRFMTRSELPDHAQFFR